MMKDLKFDELITKFITNSDYQYIIDFEKKFNIFDICQFGDDRNSSLLSWLLNPKEGHSLGDRFLKEFLLANFNRFERYSKTEDGPTKQRYNRLKDSSFFKNVDKYTLATQNFSNVSVFQDVYFSEGTPNLVLLLHEIEVAVVVENRFSNEVSGADAGIDYGQLSSLPSGYQVLYSYLDKELSVEKERRINTNWVCLDYSFAETFLENIIDRDLVPQQVNTYLKDYFVYLSGEYSGTNAFEKKHTAFDSALRSNQELISYMKEFCYEGKRLIDLSPTERFYASAKSNSREISFFLEHESVLRELISYSELLFIRDELKEKLGHEHDVDVSIGSDYISLFNRTWSSFQETHDEVWGLDLFFYKRGERQEVLFSVNPSSMEESLYFQMLTAIEASGLIIEVKDESSSAKVFLLENVTGVSQAVVIEKMVKHFKAISELLSTEDTFQKSA